MKTLFSFGSNKNKQSEADKSQRTYQNHQQQISQTNINHTLPFSAVNIERHQNPKAKLSSNTSTKALLKSIEVSAKPPTAAPKNTWPMLLQIEDNALRSDRFNFNMGAY